MEAILWIILAIFLGTVLYGIIAGTKQANAAKEVGESGSRYLRYEGVSQRIVTFPLSGHTIGINQADRKIGFITATERFVLGFDELVSIEVVSNGRTITKTNRGSQVLGAAVGGLALGGVGAIIGGLSGSTRADEKTTSVVLRLITKDIDHPLIDIVVHSGFSLRPDALKKLPYYADMEQWYARIQAIIAS